MASEIYRIDKRKLARKQLEKLFDRSDVSLVIHYSCESFFKRNDGKSPHIASIAVRYLHSGETRSFSVHHYAEKQGVPPNEIEDNYDRIEKEMLADYFKFVTDHLGYNWAHWNMRNINYGFQALEHRYQVLGGDPKIIPDSRKVDLSATLQDIYGVGYAEKPVLLNLCYMNDIRSELFLPGKKRSKSF